jgi:hypothetical protein
MVKTRNPWNKISTIFNQTVAFFVYVISSLCHPPKVINPIIVAVPILVVNDFSKEVGTVSQPGKCHQPVNIVPT